MYWSPGIVRPSENGTYEIISGHRRCRACELAGMDNMPVLIRNLNDDEATIIMVDLIFREKILFQVKRQERVAEPYIVISV